jgi:hypothetical protein
MLETATLDNSFHLHEKSSLDLAPNPSISSMSFRRSEKMSTESSLKRTKFQ